MSHAFFQSMEDDMNTGKDAYKFCYDVLKIYNSTYEIMAETMFNKTEQ